MTGMPMRRLLIGISAVGLFGLGILAWRKWEEEV